MRTFLSVAVLLVTYEPAPSMVSSASFPFLAWHPESSPVFSPLEIDGSKGKKNLRRQARLPEGRQAY